MRLSSLCFSVVFSLAMGSAGLAQDYPTRPVKIIVPYGAGGPADVYSRVVAQKLTESLKQPFVVENRPGAGSVVGTDAAAKSAGDGYTLVAITNSHTTNESLLSKLPYNLMRDFVPVATLNYSDLVMVVSLAMPVKSVGELTALAKSKPGALNYASAGVGTGYHMAGELFKAMSGVDIVHIPYKNSAAARTDIVGGQVQMMIDATTTMVPNIRAGQVKALATTGRNRSAVLPDVPTMSEAGFPGYEATIWLGLMAPAGTPKAITSKLNAEINKILATAEVKSAWAKLGADTLTMSPEEFDRYLRADIEKWAKIVKFSGAKIN